MSQFVVTTFYKFIHLDDCTELKLQLHKICNELNIKGTILLASEGINATLSGERQEIDEFYNIITTFPQFTDLEFKESSNEEKPFKRMKVRLKKEIVTFKVKDLDMSKCGHYLNAEEWDQKLQDPKAIIIDTRNYYEVAFGTFKNAIDPKTHHFSQLPQWISENLIDADKDRPILMFCTGGIRCEKSTAYMLQQGFKQVYHLKGGVLQYFKESKNKNHMWQGECFVFDERLAVDAKLHPVEQL